MQKEFTENILSMLGEEGQKWLDSIPGTIEEFEEKWSIKVDEPFHLSYNYVARATQSDGTPVVIKIGFPKDIEFQSELSSLPLFNNKGMVKQLSKDSERAVMLLERIEPGLSVDSLDDEKATEVTAQVMQKFWVMPPDSNNFIKVFDWHKGFERLRAKFEGGTGPLPKELVDRAEKIYQDLMSAKDQQYLLHGDLHHDNVISATREPWLAIDPKGLVGPRERETAPMLMNPKGFVLKSSDPKRLLGKRVAILADVLGFQKDKIAAWGFAQTVLSAIWVLEDHGRVHEEYLEIAKLLESLI